MMRTVVVSCLLALLLLLPVTGMSGTISTADIVSQTTTAALSCMRWMPVGRVFLVAVFTLRVHRRDLAQGRPLPARCCGEQL